MGEHGRFRNSTWYLFALMLGSVPAAAHHPTGITSTRSGGPIVTIPGTTLQQGAFSAFVNFENTSFDALSDAVLEAAAGRHDHVHSLGTIQSPSTGFAYGVTDRLMLSLILPYVVRTGIREGHHHHVAGGVIDNEAVNRGDTEGIGDLTVLGQYRFLGESNSFQASLLAGFKAPIGTTSERDREGDRFETEALCLKRMSHSRTSMQGKGKLMTMETQV